MEFLLSFYVDTKTESKKLVKFFTFWAKKMSIPIKLLPPTKKTKLLTLVKSPHVFKKSKEQFFISLFVVRLKLAVSNLKPVYKVLTYLINNVDLLCVKIEIRL